MFINPIVPFLIGCNLVKQFLARCRVPRLAPSNVACGHLGGSVVLTISVGAWHLHISDEHAVVNR